MTLLLLRQSLDAAAWWLRVQPCLRPCPEGSWLWACPSWALWNRATPRRKAKIQLRGAVLAHAVLLAGLTYLLTYLLSHSRGTPLSHLH